MIITQSKQFYFIVCCCWLFHFIGVLLHWVYDVHPVRYLYCDWSFPPTSRQRSFCSRIRMMLMNKIKFTWNKQINREIIIMSKSLKTSAHSKFLQKSGLFIGGLSIYSSLYTSRNTRWWNTTGKTRLHSSTRALESPDVKLLVLHHKRHSRYWMILHQSTTKCFTNMVTVSCDFTSYVSGKDLLMFLAPKQIYVLKAQRLGLILL